MRKFKIVICYFDTSVINRLLDDQSGLDLIKKLRKSLKIYLSVFTFAEIMATSQHERRLKLLMLAKDINENYRPLAMPGDLLKRSLKAIQTDAKDLNILMGPEWDGVWVALRDPQLIDEESLLESIQWKRQQEKWYQDMHDGGRLDIQKALIALSQAERMRIGSKFSELMRHFFTRSDFIKSIVFEMGKGAGCDSMTKELAQLVIDKSERWRFYLAGMAYGFFVRSVQTSNFGKRKNPGSIDTQQSIYLAACDIFVTDDKEQYRMIRLLRPCGHKRRRIMSYDQFKSWISKTYAVCSA